MATVKQVKVTLLRSTAGQLKNITASVRGLGLRFGHQKRIFVRKKSEMRIMMHDVTTASVAALPTPSDPPRAFSPTKHPVAPISPPNTNVFSPAGNTSFSRNSALPERDLRSWPPLPIVNLIGKA